MNSGLQHFRRSTVESLNNSRMAQEFCLFGKYELAEKLLRTEVEVCEVVFGDTHGRLDVPLLNLGEFLLARGRNEEALRCFLRSLMIHRCATARNTPISSSHRRQFVAQCHLAQGKLDSALKLFQYCLQTVSIAAGPRNIFSLEMYLAVAATVRLQGEEEEAAKLEKIVADSPITGVNWPKNRFV